MSISKPSRHAKASRVTGLALAKIKAPLGAIQIRNAFHAASRATKQDLLERYHISWVRRLATSRHQPPLKHLGELKPLDEINSRRRIWRPDFWYHSLKRGALTMEMDLGQYSACSNVYVGIRDSMYSVSI